jgi:hypothetical protein
MNAKIEDANVVVVTNFIHKIPDELRYADLTEPEGYVKEVDKDGRPIKPGYIAGRRWTLAPKQRLELHVQQLESSERNAFIYRILRNKVGAGRDDTERSTITDVQKGRHDT